MKANLRLLIIVTISASVLAFSNLNSTFKVNISGHPDESSSKGLPIVKRVQEKKLTFSTQLELSKYKSSLIDLFMQRKFDQLNQEFTKINGMRNFTGSSLIQSAIDGLNNCYSGLKIATEWNSGKSHSEFSEYVLADYLSSKAWQARGGGFANTVTDDGWAAFKDYNKQSKECLMRSIKINQSFSPSIVAMADHMGNSSTIQDFNSWVNLALKVEPWNISAFTKSFHYLQPRWGGSKRELDCLADSLKEVDQKISPTIMSLWKYKYAMIGIDDYERLGSGEKKDYKRRLFSELKSLYKNRVMNVYPSSAGPWISLLGVAHRFKLDAEFNETFDEATKLFPDGYMLYFRKASYLKDRHYTKYKERFDTLKKVVEIFPAAGQAWLQMAQIAEVKPQFASKKLRDEYVEQAVKNMTSDRFIRETMFLKAKILINKRKIKDAEAILSEFGLNGRSKVSALCGQLSKYYYSKKSYNPERAWAYFMLPWSLEKSGVGGLPLEDMLKYSVESLPENAEDWFEYSMHRGNYHRKKDYPLEGVVEGLKRCVDLIEDDTEHNIKHKAPYYLARYLQDLSLYAEAVKYMKMSVDVKADAWNGAELGSLLLKVARKAKKSDPMVDVAKYYTMSSEAIIKEAYHLEETGRSSRATILYAGLVSGKYGDAKKAVMILNELIDSDYLEDAKRAEAHLYLGYAYKRLKKTDEAKKSLEKSVELSKSRSTRQEAKKVLKSLSK